MFRHLEVDGKMNKRITIEGKKVHQVGYRPFLLRTAMRLRMPNFDAQNIKENGKQKILVSLGGNEKQISEFIKFTKQNIPKFAKGCKVSEEKSIPEAVMPIDEYQKLLNAEQQDNIIQGGLQIGNKIDSLKKETTRNFDKMDENFNRMDEKYDAISQGMFAVVTRLEKRDESFEKRIEKTEKSIESLLKILEKRF